MQRAAAAVLYDGRWLRESCYADWIDFERRGGNIMLGECGVYNRTPHEVTLTYLADLLATVRERNWGWALWNFRGSFGVLDSERPDVAYEEFRGHQLDRKMLELLQKY